MTLIREYEEPWQVWMKLLVALPECVLDEDALVNRMIDARTRLIVTAKGEDFGFEPVAWLSFFERTKSIDDQFRELITSESSTPQFRRLRKLAEAAVTNDPGLIHPERLKMRDEFIKQKVKAYMKEKNEVPMKDDFDEWTALWNSMNTGAKNS